MHRPDTSFSSQKEAVGDVTNYVPVQIFCNVFFQCLSTSLSQVYLSKKKKKKKKSSSRDVNKERLGGGGASITTGWPSMCCSSPRTCVIRQHTTAKALLFSFMAKNRVSVTSFFISFAVFAGFLISSCGKTILSFAGQLLMTKKVRENKDKIIVTLWSSTSIYWVEGRTICSPFPHPETEGRQRWTEAEDCSSGGGSAESIRRDWRVWERIERRSEEFNGAVSEQRETSTRTDGTDHRFAGTEPWCKSVSLFPNWVAKVQHLFWQDPKKAKKDDIRSLSPRTFSRTQALEKRELVFAELVFWQFWDVWPKERTFAAFMFCNTGCHKGSAGGGGICQVPVGTQRRERSEWTTAAAAGAAAGRTEGEGRFTAGKRQQGEGRPAARDSTAQFQGNVQAFLCSFDACFLFFSCV